MRVLHDSRSGLYRLPTGAVTTGSTLQLRLLVEDVAEAWVRIWQEDTQKLLSMKAISNNLLTCRVEMPKDPCVVWYYFVVKDFSGATHYYGNAPDELGGVGAMSDREPPSYQITVYDGAFDTPGWMRNGVMMQIMVDRFYAPERPRRENLPDNSYYHRSWNEPPVLVINDPTGDYSANDFFGGSLKGVEEKLGYLKALGVTVLYLNPIFKARSNHKYDTGDYLTIDPSFGTEADFRRLCAAAKAQGIHVVLDGVFSHVGNDSVYFNQYGTYGSGGAYNDAASPCSRWFRFKKWPTDYECWWGFKTLPSADKNDASFREFIIGGDDSVVAHWLRAGAGGWRLDVADELPMDFISALREREKAIDPDAALIGEVWEDPSRKISYGKLRSYCLGDTLDATMNYPLREAILAFMTCKWDSTRLLRTIESLRENMPDAFFYSQMNLLSSHDRPRALTILAEVGDMEPDRVLRKSFELRPRDYEKGKARLIAAWMLLCALPGMPCVYYGDEAGLYGMSDPFCRGTYPWGQEDVELRDAFAQAITRRQACQALRTGGMRLFTAGPDVLVVDRFIENGCDAFGQPAQDDRAGLAINRAHEARTVHYDDATVDVPPRSAIWLGTKPIKEG